MRNSVFALLLLAAIAIPAMIGCEKNETPDDNAVPNLIVYSNQSGEPNESANTLQAHYADEQTGNTVDFYGNYNAGGTPQQVETVRVLRNDTVINFIINTATNNFDKAILEVNGVKLETMVTFDFPAGDTSMIMSFYNMDWNTGNSDLIYSGEFAMSGGTIVEDPIYQARLAEVQDGGFVGLLAGVGVGVAVAETAVAVGAIGGSSLVGTAVGAVAVGVAAVGTSIVWGAVIVGATLVAITNANASELEPQNGPFPPGTPTQNPTPDPEPQLPPLENPCLSNGVNVTVGIDPGNVLVAIATGGTGGPYTFAWSTGATQTASTYTSITAPGPGLYSVSVMDANGCAAAGSATVMEAGECQLCASYSGQYQWSNGSTSSCITVTEAGTYTVTVSDTLLPQPQNESFVVTMDNGTIVCP